jgi:hypothetical protein
MSIDEDHETKQIEPSASEEEELSEVLFEEAAPQYLTLEQVEDMITEKIEMIASEHDHSTNQRRLMRSYNVY